MKTGGFKRMRVCPKSKAIPKAFGNGKVNDWETPIKLFAQLDKEFHFTLDPCCTARTAKCKKFYTIKEDGLRQDWAHEIVFMNPPYGGQTEKWLLKALYESRKGTVIVCLIFSSTDRSYWHNIIFPYAFQIRFLIGRLKFGNAKTSAALGSAIVIFAPFAFSDKILWYPNRSSLPSIDGFNPNQTRLLEVEKHG
jgi:site-specific DNA-methyltransferase (adenine-specific)